MTWSMHHGEAWEWLRSLPSESADAGVDGTSAARDGAGATGSLFGGAT